MRQKQHVDVLDIHELLVISLLQGGLHIDNESWLPESFIAEGRVRVQQFVIAFPQTRWVWEMMGLVEEDSTAMETALVVIAPKNKASRGCKERCKVQGPCPPKGTDTILALEWELSMV